MVGVEEGGERGSLRWSTVWVTRAFGKWKLRLAVVGPAPHWAPWLVTPLLHAHPGASKGCPSKEEIETITQAKVRIITQEEPLRKLTGHQRSIHSDAGF